MSRVLLQRSLKVAAIGSAAFISMPTAHAEGEKLSIYDNDPKGSKVNVIVESPTRYEASVAHVEKYTNDTLAQGKAHITGWMQQWKQLENDVTSSVMGVIAPEEEILPNGLYVGVAALAGTIFARNRNVLLRFLSSSAMAAGASFYFLPKTSRNICARLEQLDERYPRFRALHQSLDKTVLEAREKIDETWKQAMDSTNALKRWEESSVKDSFEATKKNVEKMYTTRSNPGVEETLKQEKE